MRATGDQYRKATGRWILADGAPDGVADLVAVGVTAAPVAVAPGVAVRWGAVRVGVGDPCATEGDSLTMKPSDVPDRCC